MACEPDVVLNPFSPAIPLFKPLHDHPVLMIQNILSFRDQGIVDSRLVELCNLCPHHLKGTVEHPVLFGETLSKDY